MSEKSSTGFEKDLMEYTNIKNVLEKLETNKDILLQQHAKKQLTVIHKRIFDYMNTNGINDEIVVPNTNWSFTLSQKKERSGLSYDIIKHGFLLLCQSKGINVDGGMTDGLIDCIKSCQQKPTTENQLQLIVFKRDFLAQ